VLAPQRRIDFEEEEEEDEEDETTTMTADERIDE